MLRTRIPTALLLAVLVAIVLEPLVANAASARVLSSLLSKNRHLRGSAEPKPEPWMGDAIPNVEVPTMRELPAVFNVSDDHPTNTPAPIPVAAIPSFVPHVKCIHTDEGCELNLYLTTKINVPAKMPPSPLILAYDQAPKFRHKFWRAPRVPVVLPMKVSVVPLEDPLQFEGLSDLEAQALADFRAGAAKAALRLGRADLAHDNKVLRRVGNADARRAAAKAAARAAVALSKAKNSMKITNKMLKAVVRAAGKIRPLAEYAAVSSQLNAAGLHVLRPGNKGDNSYEGLKVFAKTTARR